MKALIGLILLIWFPATMTIAETRVALVIGNANYENTSRLSNPINDARAVADKLQGIEFDVSLHENLTGQAFRIALGRFTEKALNADLVLIYYAGHAVEIDGINYLVPIDAEMKTEVTAQFETITLDQLLGAARAARTLGMVMLDSCRNNSLATGMVQTNGSRSLTRGLAPVTMDGESGLLISFAAESGKTAADGNGQHSPYTAALLDVIDQPGLAVDRMFWSVREKVKAATNGEQVPIEQMMIGREIFLVPAAIIDEKIVVRPKIVSESGLPKTIEDVQAVLSELENTELSAEARLALQEKLFHAGRIFVGFSRNQLALGPLTTIAQVDPSADLHDGSFPQYGAMVVHSPRVPFGDNAPQIGDRIMSAGGNAVLTTDALRGITEALETDAVLEIKVLRQTKYYSLFLHRTMTNSWQFISEKSMAGFLKQEEVKNEPAASDVGSRQKPIHLGDLSTFQQRHGDSAYSRVEVFDGFEEVYSFNVRQEVSLKFSLSGLGKEDFDIIITHESGITVAKASGLGVGDEELKVDLRSGNYVLIVSKQRIGSATYRLSIDVPKVPTRVDIGDFGEYVANFDDWTVFKADNICWMVSEAKTVQPEADWLEVWPFAMIGVEPGAAGVKMSFFQEPESTEEMSVSAAVRDKFSKTVGIPMIWDEGFLKPASEQDGKLVLSTEHMRLLQASDEITLSFDSSMGENDEPNLQTITYSLLGYTKAVLEVNKLCNAKVSWLIGR